MIMFSGQSSLAAQPIYHEIMHDPWRNDFQTHEEESRVSNVPVRGVANIQHPTRPEFPGNDSCTSSQSSGYASGSLLKSGQILNTGLRLQDCRRQRPNTLFRGGNPASGQPLLRPAANWDPGSDEINFKIKDSQII